MAAPNIVGVQTITGITTSFALADTSVTTLISNAADSGQVFKVNTIIVGNTSGSTAKITVGYNGAAAGAGGTAFIARNVGLNSETTLVVTDRASSFYLEENRSLVCQASAGGSLDVTCSYEQISS